MSLLDDLRAAAGAVDPQFQPTSNELPGVLAAVAAYMEHGDKFLKAAGQEDGTAAVTELLAPSGNGATSTPAETKPKGKGD